MSTPLRIGGFVAGLLVLLGVGFGVGRVAGPVDDEPSADEHAADHAGDGDTAGHGAAHGADHGAGHAGHGEQLVVNGLQVSQAGYTLDVDEGVSAGRADLRLSIIDPNGEPLTSYDEQHEKDLHLIVVRRDLTGFQHVHPELGPDGVWSVPVDLTPGAWRVFADFKPAGADPLVLGADLLVSGAAEAARLGEDALAHTVDGYDVTLGAALAAGRPTPVTLTVTKDGQPVDDLEPYLGAHGHLVVLRAGDLGYLHAHPTDDDAGPAITFETTFPSDGRYRLFLDFRHGGTVRTAQFTVTVGGGGHDHSTHDHGTETPAGSADPSPSHDDGHDHEH